MGGSSNTDENMKPSIKVFYDSDHLSLGDFIGVLLGIEEEGIPYDLQSKQSDDALDLAHNASLSSRLGVGVGISKEGIVLQYEKLDKEAPLFKIKFYQTDQFRNLGSNAARLVKKMPFRTLD